MFQKAIVRKPSERFEEGLTTSTPGLPNLEKALAQHSQHINALRECSEKVTVLEGDSRFPDNTFVKDEAVIVGKLTALTRPGNPGRGLWTTAFLPLSALLRQEWAL